MENIPILYILMRTDLPSMNPGKAMAQASHASNAFVQSVYKDEDNFLTYKLWEESTDQGFGTVIVLSVSGEILKKVVRKSLMIGLNAGIVTDPTYPYIVNNEVFNLIDKSVHTVQPIIKEDCVVLHRKEDTCGWVLVSNKTDENVIDILGSLELHY